MSTSNALSTFLVSAAAFVYESVDPMTNVAFYVGRSNNLARRCCEHQKKCVKKIRELMKLKNFKFRDVTRRVPELPHGCHERDVQEMESFFIFHRRTLNHPVDAPHGCNSRNGDYSIEMDTPRYYEIEAMFAPDGPGYQFPTTEPKELADARAEMVMAGEYLEMAKEVGDKEAIELLQECTALSTCVFYDLEAKTLDLRTLIERTLTRYEGKFVDSVNVNILQCELNGIKEKMAEREEFSDLQRIISSMSLVCKAKEGVDVTSEAAVHVLKLVLAMIAPREEAALKWTHNKLEQNMKATRTWTRANGLRKPTTTAKDAAERTLGTFLDNWKCDNARYGGKCTDLASCEVVMRDVPWFGEYVRAADKQKDEWKELNRQLRDGFAHHTEPEFEGKKAIVGVKGNRGVYLKLHSLLDGRGSEANVAIALAGLTASRRSHYHTAWATARQPMLRALKESDARRKRAREGADPNAEGFPKDAADEAEAEAEEEEEGSEPETDEEAET